MKIKKQNKADNNTEEKNIEEVEKFEKKTKR